MLIITSSRFLTVQHCQAMVVITQLGAFSFISKHWTGSTSDTHITRESCLLDLLEEGGRAMTDRGFTIMNLLTKKVVLTIPLLNPPPPPPPAPLLPFGFSIFSWNPSELPSGLANMRNLVYFTLRYFKWLYFCTSVRLVKEGAIMTPGDKNLKRIEVFSLALFNR